jgi:AraC-like DNA-binding protein
MRADLPASLHARLELSLYRVEVGRYASLALADITWPHWVVSFVRQGRVETATRGVRSRAGDGDAMIHPPHLPFSERADVPGTHLYFVFDARVPPHLDLLRLNPIPPVVRVPSPADYADTFGRLLDAWASPASPARDVRAFALATDLLAAILDGWQAMGAPPRPAALQTPEDRFADVIGFMAAHLDRRLTRDDLAGRVCLHPGYFDRAFRAAYGLAPMQMLRDLRLRRARQLLEDTDLTLDSIAAACGLGDAAAFSRAFRARYGAAPGQHRQSAKQTRQAVLYPLEADTLGTKPPS